MFSLLTIGGAQAQEPAAATLPALQVVVLVDESGSLKEPDVVKEREAARTIAFSVLAPGSIVSVAGFGSSNAPGQSAVKVYCPPTQVNDAQARDSIAQCVGGLHRRSKQEGDGTDHVAALQQALATVRSGGPDKKLVFLLTDGKLDVSESPAWGDTPERRNGAAAAKVKEVLTDLERVGAQVWPLGFGSVDQAALRGFAKGKSCTPAATDPHEQVTQTEAELRIALREAFSSASCVKYGPIETGSLPRGGSVDLTIEIPTIASDASIVVYKRDPRVQVEYRAKNAGKPAPEAGGAHFELAGQNTETESLRITDPEPGPWIIHLSSADVPTQDVAATVVYQAAVKAYLTVSPPQPAAGQTVDINMQVWARDRAITDQAALQGLSFGATLTGSANFPAQQANLTDPDHDGTFAGQLKVPDGVSGGLTFTGQVSGIGIGGDTRTLSTEVQSRAAAVQAQILFDSNRAEVRPGGSVSGRVNVTNNSGQPAKLRLLITEPARGTAVTIEPAEVQAGAGTSTTAFALHFGANTLLGNNAATLRLVDDGNPQLVVAQRLYSTNVTPEPTVLQKLWWLWTILGVLLVAGLVLGLLRLRAHNDRVKVRGLRVQLAQHDTMITELKPNRPNAKVFRFVLQEEFYGPQLRHAGPGETNVYELRRTDASLEFTQPGTHPIRILPNEPKEIDGGLTLTVIDDRWTSGSDGSGPVAAVSFNAFAGASGNGATPVESSIPNYNPFEPGPSTPPPATGPVPVPNPLPTPPPVIDPFGTDSSGGNPSPGRRHDTFDPNNPFG
jgi:hypothetical protein